MGEPEGGGCPVLLVVAAGGGADAGDRECAAPATPKYVDCLSFYVVLWRFLGVSAMFLDSDLHRLRLSARLVRTVNLCGCVAEWAIGHSRADLGTCLDRCAAPPSVDLAAVS